MFLYVLARIGANFLRVKIQVCDKILKTLRQDICIAQRGGVEFKHQIFTHASVLQRVLAQKFLFIKTKKKITARMIEVRWVDCEPAARAR